jgi:hypothetical protein
MALLNNQMVYEIYPYDAIPNMMGRKKKKHVPNHQSD